MAAGRPLHRFTLKKVIVVPLAVMAMVPAGLALAHPALAAGDSDQPCTPSTGTEAVFGEWTPSGDFTQTPQDPDGETDDDSALNLKRIGEREETWVPGTQSSPTQWADDGDQIRTEENAAPDADSDLVRYQFLGETAPDVITPAVSAQHYSWNGGHLDVNNPPTVVPENDDWQPNTTQEPHTHGEGAPATWVNASLHYTANSSGHASWFYFIPGTEAVTDTDFLWQKQVRSFEPGTSGHMEYRWSVEHRTYTEGTDPVTCDDQEQPPVDGGGDDPTTPSVPTEVKGQTAQTPSSAPTQLAQSHAANQPAPSPAPGANRPAVPLSIDAGL